MVPPRWHKRSDEHGETVNGFVTARCGAVFRPMEDLSAPGASPGTEGTKRCATCSMPAETVDDADRVHDVMRALSSREPPRTTVTAVRRQPSVSSLGTPACRRSTPAGMPVASSDWRSEALPFEPSHSPRQRTEGVSHHGATFEVIAAGYRHRFGSTAALHRVITRL